MNEVHGIRIGECHSLRMRLVKGQAHLVQVWGHLQVRSGSGKKGTGRKRRAEQELSVKKSRPLNKQCSPYPDKGQPSLHCELCLPNLTVCAGDWEEGAMGTGLANF